MTRLTGRGYTTADQAAFLDRAAGSHTVRWRAEAHRLSTSGDAVLLDDVPIVGGTLTLDSSDPIRRKLTIEVGGGESLVPRTSNDPLVPFGQYLVLYLTIDRADGSWFPWIKQGEYPIASYVFERPSMIATVEATDWSGRVEEYLHLDRHGYKKEANVRAAILDMVGAAVPERAWDLGQFAEGKGIEVRNYVADAGVGRWTSATELAAKKGLETYFDWNGDLVIRRALTQDNDDVLPSDGPDIGTVSDPIAEIAEGINLVGLTATLTREGGCNYVRFNLSGTVTRRDKKQTKKKGVETTEKKWTDHVDSTTGSGSSVAWGSAFGRLPIVEEHNLHKLGADGSAERAQEQQRANNLRLRRLGVIRYIDLDMVGGYQLEPDDKVALTFGGATEYHYVQSVAFDLTGRVPTRIRTRQLATDDPGA